MLIIGHRGAGGYVAENTLASFSEALRRGVDMVELDVYRCASGELVVIHDDTLERTTTGKGQVGEKNLAELRVLDAGNGQHIPTLKEVIELIGRRIPINIELKGPGTAQPVAQLLAAYFAQGWQYKDFLVSSFSSEQIDQFRALQPQIAAGQIFENFSALSLPKLLAQRRMKTVVIDKSMVNARYVAEVHRAGLTLYVYTVNDTAEIQGLQNLEVDGVYTDYPPQRIARY